METTLFCTLKPEDAADIFNIVLEANRNNYPLLVHKYQSLEDFQQELRAAIQSCFDKQKQYQQAIGRDMEYNYGMRVDGKLVAVMLSADQPIMDIPTHIFHQYSTMLAGLGIESVQPGSGTFFTRLGVLPEFMRKGIGKRLVMRGYEYAMLGTKVERSYTMFRNLGGEILKQGVAVRPNFTYKITLMKVDFRKLMKIYQESMKNHHK